MDQARCWGGWCMRGPCGARDEFLLAATAQNLRKLAKLITPPTPLPATGGRLASCFSGRSKLSWSADCSMICHRHLRKSA
jgi:hypothetical protein